MLLEPFKAQVNAERKLHLDEQKAADLKPAAVLADEMVAPTSLILSRNIGRVTIVVNHSVNLVVMKSGHLRRLPVITLAVVN